MTFARHPRFRRAESFPSMELTPRDAEILRMVNQHRFLRSNHIVALVGGSHQQVLRRLQRLYHHGYLERPACQLDYYQRSRSRTIAYGLASRGAAHLRRVGHTRFPRLDGGSSTRSVKRLFLEHALMVSDIMVALEIACRHRGNVRLLIEDEIPLPAPTRAQRAPFQWTVTVSRKEKLRVIPDRVFALEGHEKGERILCFLEADRGTMPVYRHGFDKSSVCRKFAAYRATWCRRIHSARFGDKRLRVLTVTETEERAIHLRKGCRALTPGAGIFLFSTRAEITSAANCLLTGWTDANRNSRSLAA